MPQPPTPPQRIDTVIDKNKQNQLDKRLTYLAKQEEIRKFKIENEIVLKEKAEQLAKNLAERQARQRGKKEESMKFYEDKKNRTLTQLADREQFIQVVEMEREHERSVKNLNMELAEADKRANVQRIKRMDEFMRLQTMKKLQSDDARTVAIR